MPERIDSKEALISSRNSGDPLGRRRRASLAKLFDVRERRPSFHHSSKNSVRQFKQEKRERETERGPGLFAHPAGNIEPKKVV